MKYIINNQEEPTKVDGLLELLEALTPHLDLSKELVCDWQMQLFSMGFIVINQGENVAVVWDK